MEQKLVNESEYDVAMSRYQEIKYATAGSPEHSEKMCLVGLIEEYEEANDNLPEVTDAEFIEFRMQDLSPNDDSHP